MRVVRHCYIVCGLYGKDVSSTLHSAECMTVNEGFGRKRLRPSLN